MALGCFVFLVAVVNVIVVGNRKVGVEEDDLDLSSEEEALESDLDGVDDSDTESVTARRR